MHQLLTTCPACNGELISTQLQCNVCGVTVGGRFSLGRLGRLNREQLRFVELLVKNRGNINQVASDLNVSYTTARTRMDEIVLSMGFNAPPEEPVGDRRDILRRLEAGEITAEDALRMLRR